MWMLIILAVLVLVAVFIVYLFTPEEKQEAAKCVYSYSAKKYFLTPAEHECYDALVAAVGDEYHVFAQVHLDAILDEKIPNGQSWKGARSHINQKSVDFLLCDKKDISPRLVIELDDKTHARPDRKDRDIEVERMLKEARIPLLRIQNHGRFDPVELKLKIQEILVT